MNILEEIIAYKYKEVAERKSLFPVKLLEKTVHFNAPTVSLKQYLSRDDKCGIIAEIKRKSPSKGIINNHVSVEQISIGYMQAGAAALSILTDTKYFGGSSADLTTARKFNYCPILRKEFIVDEYQVIEAKSIGADAILLIAAALEPARLKSLAEFARSFHMEVLMEVHNEQELNDNVHDAIDILGVNNRDLNTFSVSTDTSKKLSTLIPDQYLKISESGIREPEDIIDLMAYGYKGFLIGESFMKNSRPEKSCQAFISKLKTLKAAAGKR